MDRRLAAQGRPLFEELRRLTGLYAPPAAPHGAPVAQGASAREAPPVAEPLGAAVGAAGVPVPAQPASGEALEAEGLEQVERLDRALYEAWQEPGDEACRERALRLYLDVKSDLARRFRRFEIVNNRIFRDATRLLVPYRVDAHLLLRSVGPQESATLLRGAVVLGKVLTDRLLATLAGEQGAAVDLEREIFEFDPTRTPEIRIERIRDLVALLERLNHCGSRHEAVFHLRFAVARLCSLLLQGLPGRQEPAARGPAA